MIGNMQFTTDWVSTRHDWWLRLTKGFVGNPVSFLEVGFYEGRSAQWWLSNVLTHPSSSLVSVDKWASKGAANRALILSDPSVSSRFVYFEEDALRWASRALGFGMPETFDLIYSDFSKESADILALACTAFRLLKPGGVYLFDDYTWRFYEGYLGPRPALEPKEGIDAFVSIFKPFIESIEYSCGQVAVWKK